MFKFKIFGYYVFLLIFAFLTPMGFRLEASPEEDNDKASAKELTVNLISRLNGVGLRQDIEIFRTKLEKLGYIVRYHFWNDSILPEKADLNIFIQYANPSLFSYADKNYFLPNAEYCPYSQEMIAQFDMILCKTKECERIFKQLNDKTIYLGFTCMDRYDEKVIKNFKSPIHLAGASVLKNTEMVFKSWCSNPQFPQLILLKHKHLTGFSSQSNLDLVTNYLTNEELNNLLNARCIHLCPSITEGFGHYIVEGLSCGAIVVTTNAPPMNEFVKDKRCLVDFHHTDTKHYATLYYADPKKFEEMITKILSLPEQELQEIGRKNRKFYLKMNNAFNKRFAEIFAPV